MADAAAAAAPPGGNDVNGNTNQPPIQPTSPRRALKITILVILLMFIIFLASFNASMRHLIEVQKKE
eukprot:scaffold40210_cov266-Skeletonema_dohrnii-CCMP3373.AAC.1